MAVASLITALAALVLAVRAACEARRARSSAEALLKQALDQTRTMNREQRWH